ncbi:MAG: Spy/CpxP family protein refolding chaperone [Candidatus Halalkalibacterium sp. M3_1C_030]
MDYNKKYRWAMAGFLVMLFLNIAIISGIWIFRPGGHFMGREGAGQFRMQRFIEQELNLSEDQKQAFRELRRDHIRETRNIHRDIRIYRRSLFGLLQNEEVNVKKVDSLSKALGEAQRAMEKATYEHFAELRSICDDQQKEKFDRITERVMLRLNRGSNGAN